MPPSISGVLLAGGASRRFGAEKVLAMVDRMPLFHHPLRALAAVCDEVVVVIAPEGPELPLPPDVRLVRFARDPIAFQGPLIGLRTGLRALSGPSALVAGADMVRLRPALLELMRDRLAETERPAVALADADGVRPLPLAQKVVPALLEADRLAAQGERRLRALVTALAPELVSEADWARVDPAGEWRIDVDAPEDLPRETAG
jgi:molybdopterin-guanine dinucleotide biosynthesis protein A